MNRINLSDPIPDQVTFNRLYRSATGQAPRLWTWDMIEPQETTYANAFRLMAYVSFYGVPDNWDAVRQATGMVFHPQDVLLQDYASIMESIARYEPAIIVDVHGFYVILSGGNLREGV